MIRSRIVVLVLATGLLAGCGGKNTPHTTMTGTKAAQMALKVYFYRGNALVPVTVRVPHTEAVATAAVSALLAGPPHGYESAIPTGVSLESVAISNGTATVHLSSTELSHAGLGQIVYTLASFPTITSVDGATRDDFADLTSNAAIFVAEPLRDSTVPAPVHASGTADVFEGTLAVDVWSGGKLLRTQTIQATSGTGTRGTWSASIDLPPGPAKLEFYEPSAENGSHLHTAEVDLTVR